MARGLCAPLFYGLSVRFQLLSTPCRHDAVTFSLWREAPPRRDFHPPVRVPFQAHESARRCAAFRTLARIISPIDGVITSTFVQPPQQPHTGERAPKNVAAFLRFVTLLRVHTGANVAGLRIHCAPSCKRVN